MIHIILVDSNDQVRLFKYLNSIDLLGLIKRISTWVLHLNELTTEVHLIPVADPTHLYVIKDLYEIFELDPESRTFLVEDLFIISK
jgi:hypothetical protein